MGAAKAGEGTDYESKQRTMIEQASDVGARYFPNEKSYQMEKGLYAGCAVVGSRSRWEGGKLA